VQQQEGMQASVITPAIVAKHEQITFGDATV